MPYVALDNLLEVSRRLLESMGLSSEDAQTVADTIEYANSRGVPTHGAGRLPLYRKNIDAGNIDPKAVPEIVVDSDAIGVVDGHNALGQVASKTAMDLALAKVKRYGVAMVAVRNSNNFGTAGYYGAWSAREGCGAIVMANASPAMAPTGGTKPLFGTNPICMAMPGAGGKVSIVLDMATTVVARTKIRSAAKEGIVIPADWALDAQGNPTTNAQEALDGTLLPIGGYKGYGLSLFVDLFAGMLAQGAFAGDVVPLSDLSAPSRNGHVFIVFDISRFMSQQVYEAAYNYLVEQVKACGSAVLLPGERGSKAALTCDGVVEITKKQFEEINAMAQDEGLAGLEEVCND